MTKEILCIGSVLWDIVGRTPHPMTTGADEPGKITRLPGGVAMNIAMTLQRFGQRAILISAIGQDSQGEALTRVADQIGLVTKFLYKSPHLPTDRYMAIEDQNGLVAAIADAQTLEAHERDIIAPLKDGRLGNATSPYSGTIALDGNLTVEFLTEISQSPYFAKADLRVAPASPGKVRRLRPLIAHTGTTLYVNRAEAGYLTDTSYENAYQAAQGLLEIGAKHVLVTDGAHAAAEGIRGECTIEAPSPHVQVKRITGAGDTFMAAHIDASKRGLSRAECLNFAQKAAATYVSGAENA